jgi:hypothetical protein
MIRLNEMRAFEVYLNKRRLCLAGIGDNGVMSAILNTGDEIRVKIVESKVVDKSRVVHRRDLAQEKRAQKRYVRAMAKQFGWKIVAPPKKAQLQ